MKLRRYTRDTIISAIMKDVPRIDYAEQARNLFQKAFCDGFPPSIKAIYDNIDTRHFLSLERFYFNHVGYIYIHGPKDFRPNSEVYDELKVMEEKSKAQSDEYSRLR